MYSIVMRLQLSYLFIAVVRQVLEFERPSAVELPFPVPDFLPDQDDRIDRVDVLVGDVVAGEDGAVRRLRRSRA